MKLNSLVRSTLTSTAIAIISSLSLCHASFASGSIKSTTPRYNQKIAISAEPKSADDYFDRGSKKVDQEDYRGGIADFDQAIKLDPKSAKAYLGRGLAKISIDDYRNGLADLDRAIAADPQSANIYTLRGVSKFRSGQKQAAITDVEKAAELARQANNTKSYQIIKSILERIKAP